MRYVELLGGALLVVGVLLFIAKYTIAYEEVAEMPFYFFISGLIVRGFGRIFSRRTEERVDG